MSYTIDKKKYYGVQEFAHKVGVSRITILNWMKRGLPFLKIGLQNLIPDIEANTWILKNTISKKTKRIKKAC